MNSIINACSPAIQDCLVKKPTAYGPYILVMIPIAAICLGWFFRRIIHNLDAARVAQFESLRRHDDNNKAAVEALRSVQANQFTELSSEIIATQRELSHSFTKLVEEVSIIKGQLAGVK